MGNGVANQRQSGTRTVCLPEDYVTLGYMSKNGPWSSYPTSQW